MMGRISRREAEVLEAIGEHLTNAEIAERLFISVRTVESHVSALLRKLDVDDRRALARVAHERAEAASPKSNLPYALTSFIGREEEVSTVVSALAESRLVTLSGTGGVGKTRLAVEVGRHLIQEGSVSVWAVDLAPVSDGPGVLPAIDAALHHPSEPGRAPLDALTAVLERRASVVILDNCEHVIDAVADVASRLLSRTIGLRMLLTSREALGIAAERAIQVEPLSVPPEQPMDPAAIANNDGVRLFADRARSIDSRFAVEASAPAVASIVRHLDGLPLALELAAAQVLALSPEQIDVRLRDRFALLGGRSQDPRHGTLGTMLDWSYQLLTSDERAVLDRLAVFRGSFTIDAAESVAGTDNVDPSAVGTILAGLVRKSLVVVVDGGSERRYRLLETVREFGWRRLEHAGELSSLRDRHRAWAFELAKRGEEGLAGPDEANWLDRLDEDLDNLEAAFGWSVEDPERAGPAMRVVLGLHSYWLARGTRRVHGARWSEATAAAATTTELSLRTRILLAAVSLVMWSDLEAAERLATATERLAGDNELSKMHVEIAWTWIAGLRGSAPPPLASRAAAAGVDERMLRWVRMFDLMFRGLTEPPEDVYSVIRTIERETRDAGDEHLAGGWSDFATDFAVAAGHGEAERSQTRDAWETATRFFCASCEATALASLVLVDDCADLGGRVAAAQRAVELADGIGEVFTVYHALDVLAGGLADAGDLERAVLIGRGVVASRAVTGYAQVLPAREAERLRGLELARANLSPDRYAELEEEAAGLSYRELVAIALA